MKRAAFRSTVFNILFYFVTALMCVTLLPTLILPRKVAMAVVWAFVNMVYLLERFVLGLKYEIRGAEHLPKSGSYILAAKHQSAYETMKLHKIFKDPAVILKKELLRIPLWGLYLKKSDPIAIDRSTPDAAIESIQNGALRMKEQGRPIVIFPQGTRVSVDTTVAQRPYKVGVARVQEATGLDIIPMAMNAGMYWPKHGWLKSPGTVIFEFLPPVPSGMERAKLLKKLEEDIEGASISLMNEARESEMDRKRSSLGPIIGLLSMILIAFGIYSFAWFSVADHIRAEYPRALEDLVDPESQIAEPEIYGFPGKIKMRVPQERLASDKFRFQIEDFYAEGWPIPNLPVHVQTGTITVRSYKWGEPLTFDTLDGDFVYRRDVLTLNDAQLTQKDFKANFAGDIDTSQEPLPKLDLDIRLENHTAFLQSLTANRIIDLQMALFVGAGLSSLSNDEGVVELPLEQRKDTIYLGPLPVHKISSPREENTEEPRRDALTPSE